MARDSLGDIGGDDGGQADGDQGGEMDPRLPSERPTARTRAAPRTRTLDGALREGGAAPGQSETGLADAGETATARPDFGDLGSDQRQQLRAQAAADLDEQVDGRTIRRQDIELQDGRARLREQTVAELALSDLNERVDTDVTRSDLRIRRSGGTTDVRLTADARQDILASRVAEETGLDRGDDFEIAPQPVPDAQRRANPDARETQVLLTDEGEQALAGQQDSGGSGGFIGQVVDSQQDAIDNLTDAAPEVRGIVPDAVADPVADVADASLDLGGDALSATADAPVVTQTLSGVRTAGDEVGDVSEAAADRAESFIDSVDTSGPGAGGQAVSVPQQIFGSSATKGAVGFVAGLPAAAAGTVAGVEDAFQDVQEEVRQDGIVGGTGDAVAAGGVAAGTAGVGLATSFRDRPIRTTGRLTGTAIAGTAATPLRARKLKVPRQDSPDTTVRGAELTTPPAANALLPDRLQVRRTVAGVEGRSPTVGSPTISNLDDVNVERLGSGTANKGPVFLPRTEFEAEVFGRSVLDEGGQAADRFASGTALLEAGETVTGNIRSGRVDDIEPTVRAAEDVPDDADAGEIADALAEADATVFGSGAVRAQADEFRDPGDIDIVVPDKTDAKAALEPTLEGTARSVGDVFDVKEPDDFAGLNEGEVFALGQRSRSPTATRERSIDVNPLGEELQRKTVASLFLRDDPIGDPGVDVGPRPVRDPDTPVREKDPKDASAIAQAIGVDETAVRRFETAFGLRERALTEGGTPDFSDASPSTLVTGRDTSSPSPSGAVAGAQSPAGGSGPLGSDPPPTGADSPEIGGVESPSPGVNPGGSTSRPPSQMADESPSPSPSPSDADSPVPSPPPSDTPSPPPSSPPSPSPPPSGTPSPAPSPGPAPSDAPSPSPSPGPAPSPSPSPNAPPPPSSPPPGAPPTAPGPGPPTQPRLDDPTDDDPEEELLFVSGAVDERFINPIERLGDADAGPDIESPPEFDGPEYGGP